MKSLKGILVLVTAMLMTVSVTGCAGNDNATTEPEDIQLTINEEIASLNSQLEMLANTEEYISIGDRQGEEFDVRTIVDYSKLIQIMNENKDNYTYKLNNVIEIPEEFFDKSYEDQVDILNIFKVTGYEEKTVAIEYDYVPTGEKTEDGKDLTTFEATEHTQIIKPLFVKVNDIECIKK